ncbi:uncharacterized protein LOC133168464 [Syngnathus typhle]|uniref:uncharacterized protein LOC133168464 n=1 Tax=Syngnathus typhle TaxID=161592 RepID=UPI002A6A2DAC|nr:uncharacterized protein LOC133168464 [Syngnathus typhle]XP_061156037.1 uncharacterized protein LOC133168464 [Syngnathus typhle]
MFQWLTGCVTDSMILLGPTLCLPSQATVQELFVVARDANAVPNISLDPVLGSFLSLDSSAALQHQYTSLQRSLSEGQRAALGLRLNRELPGGRVTLGGVGVVALALSLLLDHVGQQVRGNISVEAGQWPLTSPPKKIFGIAVSSRIGRIAHNYLSLIPGLANDQELMAETTEIYDNWLNLEMLDHYHRMTKKKRMSSVSMQQWLTGAAFHLHMRIHQVRLHSVPTGSAESLRLSYKTALNHLLQGYTVYLHGNIQETAASLAEHHGNGTCSSELSFNISQAKTLDQTSHDGICRTHKEGVLVIEPGRNVTHGVWHHPCESPAIQQALVTRIINAQDLEHSRSFFLHPKKVFQRLLTQEDAFELSAD